MAVTETGGRTILRIDSGADHAGSVSRRLADALTARLVGPNDQLVQRLISQETGIDSQRLRLGDIHDHEWPLFVQAANVLSDAQIFLDDTPALTPNQLRAKCRRLDQEYESNDATGGSDRLHQADL